MCSPLLFLGLLKMHIGKKGEREYKEIFFSGGHLKIIPSHHFVGAAGMREQLHLYFASLGSRAR